jgi:3-phenylpropionate/cinnamic acid dioxygenase small subunit
MTSTNASVNSTNSAACKTAPALALNDLQQWFSVQSFLVYEARLLDDYQLEPWLDLLTDDIRYWMPLVTNRVGRDIGQEISRYGEVAHFDEDKTSLRNRVKRLATGMAWAETPRSRTRHLISNVEVLQTLAQGALQVRSSFLVYRSHLEHDSEVFSGWRDDELRPQGDSWRIARRSIVIDQAVVTQKNLGLFF